MDLIEYQRLALAHVLHVMACDGEVDRREVDEIRRMTRDTPYFDELDAERELHFVLERLSSGGPEVIEAAFAELDPQDMSARQRLRLLDVLLHVVHADSVVNDAERAYLQRVRDVLEVPIEEVARQFPSRFSLFVPGAGGTFHTAVSFSLPETLPDASQFM